MSAPTFELRSTSAGDRYAVALPLPARPAPTVIKCAGAVEEALSPVSLQAGRFLLGADYQFLAVELPCHGTARHPGEPEGLDGWARRVHVGGNLVGEFCARISGLIDHIVDDPMTDPERIVLSGVSRGGYLALCAAAADPRVRCVATYAPVTDLRRLREFATVPPDRLEPLDLSTRIDALVGRPVFIVIGDRDHRVGTDAAIGFAQALSQAAERADVPSGVALHVLSEPRGHTTPPTGAELAAQWIHRTLGAPGGPLTM